MIINKFNQRNGQTALSLVLLIGGVIVIVGITLAFLVLNFIYSSYGSRDINKAAQLALAGVQDAALKISRNKDLGDPGCEFRYEPNFSSEVLIRVLIAKPTSTGGICYPPGVGGRFSLGPNQFVVRSQATISGKVYVLFALLSVDRYSGKVDIVNLKVAGVKDDCGNSTEAGQMCMCLNCPPI